MPRDRGVNRDLHHSERALAQSVGGIARREHRAPHCSVESLRGLETKGTAPEGNTSERVGRVTRRHDRLIRVSSSHVHKQSRNVHIFGASEPLSTTITMTGKVLVLCALAAWTATAQDWTNCPTSTGWIENDKVRTSPLARSHRADSHATAPSSSLRGRTRTANGSSATLSARRMNASR